MALKIVQKKKDKVSYETKEQKYSKSVIKISAIGSDSFSQKGFNNYKKYVIYLKNKGFSDEELKSSFQKLYLDDFIPVKELRSQLEITSLPKIKKIEKTFKKINDILFNYLLTPHPDFKNEIDREDVSNLIKFFDDLLKQNRADLEDIKIYSAYKNDNEQTVTLYSRLKKELNMFYTNLKKESSSSLSNLYSLFKTIQFVSKEILAGKNNYLLGSMEKITKKNHFKPIYLNSFSIMNYGHGAEALTAIDSLNEGGLTLDDITQFDISDWNSYHKFQISEAEKLKINGAEEISSENIASIDLLEKSKSKISLVEVKHYSENGRGEFNIYLKRPYKMKKNFSNIIEFSKVLGRLESKISGKSTGGKLLTDNQNIIGEAIYDFTLYNESGVASKVKISMDNYFKLFHSIGEYLKENINSNSISNKRIEIIINDTSFYISFNLSNNSKITDDVIKENNIFDGGSMFNGISSFSLNFPDSGSFLKLLKEYGGKEYSKSRIIPKNKIIHKVRNSHFN